MAVDGSLDAFKREFQEYRTELTNVINQIVPHAQRLDEHAADLTRMGDMLAMRKIDPLTIGENTDLAATLADAQTAAKAVTAAAYDAQKSTQAAHDQLQTSGGGIQEAARRAPVNVSDVAPTWLQPE